jgi:hypothetical protein
VRDHGDGDRDGDRDERGLDAGRVVVSRVLRFPFVTVRVTVAVGVWRSRSEVPG